MIQPKERPILFSAPMVRAILAGEKTVTRRAINPQFPPDVSRVFPYLNAPGTWMPPSPHDENEAWEEQMRTCPYGKPGGRLWVREAWAADAQVDSIAPRNLSQGEPIWYPADGSTRQTGCSMLTRGRGRPSIHMPRWASRILLEITSVRVERLQAISDEQCVAEGCGVGPGAIGVKLTVPPGASLPCAMFAELWKSINGASAWDANPWVWVVEFKRVMP